MSCRAASLHRGIAAALALCGHAGAQRLVFEPPQDSPYEIDYGQGVEPRLTQWLNQAEAAVFREDWPAAARALEQAIALDPRWHEAVVLLGDVYLKMGRHEQALALAEEVVRERPSFVGGFRARGDALVAEGRPDEAIMDYDRALTLDPDDALTRQRLGLAMAGALRLRPLGDVPSTAGAPHMGTNLQAVVERHLRTLAKRPNDAEAHRMLSVLLAARGRNEEALDHARRALELDPSVAEAHNNLGVILALVGEAEASRAAYERALELQPKLASAHRNLGFLYAATGVRERAVHHYREAATMDPRSAVSHAQLGALLKLQGAWDEAAASLKTALSLKPDLTAPRYHLGDIRAAQGQYAKAAAYYREALERLPDHPAVLNNLAWLLATAADEALRDADEAYRLARRAAGLLTAPSPEALETLAVAAAASGRNEEARGMAARAASLAREQGREKLAASIEQNMAGMAPRKAQAD